MNVPILLIGCVIGSGPQRGAVPECEQAWITVALASCTELSLECGRLKICVTKAKENTVVSVADSDRQEELLINQEHMKNDSESWFPFRGYIVWLSIQETSQTSVLTAFAPMRCPRNEDEKIGLLIRSINAMSKAVFIRNGQEYSALQAADHLRSKYVWKKQEIKTAEDFIERVASRSSASGTEYKIRLEDTVKSSEEVLRGTLRLFDSACREVSKQARDDE